MAMYRAVLDLYGLKGFTMKVLHHILKKLGGVDRRFPSFLHFHIGEQHEVAVSHFQGAAA